jgi:hypothetical protein
LSAIARNSLSSITCRALAVEKRLLNWSKEALASDGELILWVGYEDCERLRGIQSWSWSEPTQIPRTERRYIVTGRPIRL